MMFFLRVLTIKVLVAVFTEAKYRELYLKSKGLIKVYFDGYLVEHFDRLSADVYLCNMPENVSFVSLYINNNPEREFIISSTDGLIKTDKSWKCKATLTKQEEKLWPYPEFTLKNTRWSNNIKVAEKKQKIANFSTTSQFIWPRDVHCCNAYCFYQTGNTWKTKSFNPWLPHGKIRITVIGQGGVRVFQDGAWVSLLPYGLKPSGDLGGLQETSTLKILKGLIDRSAEMLSILVDISEIYSPKNDGNQATHKEARFSFTLFSDSGEISTEGSSNNIPPDWKCIDTVGATRHGASEPWQWSNFYDAYWKNPVSYDFTIPERLLLSGENASKMWHYQDQSDLWSRKFSWIWLDEHPWTKVVYCRFPIPKASEDAATFPIEDGDDVVLNSKFKRSDDGMSKFQFSVFTSIDHSTDNFPSNHPNREQKDSKEMQDISDDTSEMVENYLSVSDMPTTLPETTISNDLRFTDYDSSNLYESVAFSESDGLKLMSKVEEELSNLNNLSQLDGEDDNLAYDDYALEHGIELFITARDDLILFVDGYQLPFLKERPMEQAAHFMLDPLSQVLAVQAASFGGPAGILASGEKNQFLNTDSRWRCTTETPGVGWNNTNFDDSGWPHAREIARNDEETVLKLVKLIRQDAYWIWARRHDEEELNVDGTSKKSEDEEDDEDDDDNDDEDESVTSRKEDPESEELEIVFCRFNLGWIDEDQSQVTSAEEGNPVLTFNCPTKTHQ